MPGERFVGRRRLGLVGIKMVSKLSVFFPRSRLFVSLSTRTTSNSSRWSLLSVYCYNEPNTHIGQQWLPFNDHIPFGNLSLPLSLFFSLSKDWFRKLCFHSVTLHFSLFTSSRFQFVPWSTLFLQNYSMFSTPAFHILSPHSLEKILSNHWIQHIMYSTLT